MIAQGDVSQTDRRFVVITKAREQLRLVAFQHMLAAVLIGMHLCFFHKFVPVTALTSSNETVSALIGTTALFSVTELWAFAGIHSRLPVVLFLAANFILTTFCLYAGVYLHVTTTYSAADHVPVAKLCAVAFNLFTVVSNLTAASYSMAILAALKPKGSKQG